jgi:CarD family transcriptional regulator
MAAKKAMKKFRKGEYIVYPTHGVGKVTSIESDTIAGFDLELYVISFEKEKMTLRVPLQKVEQLSLRSLSSAETMKDAFTTLQGRARVKRTMWSRRAQEYEAKINSGSLVQVAEVVRDLYRNADQPDQSYSERQIYQSALERLVRELAAVDKVSEEKAQEKLEEILSIASPVAVPVEDETDEDEDADDTDEATTETKSEEAAA